MAALTSWSIFNHSLWTSFEEESTRL